MKLKEIKTEVFYMADVETLSALKDKFAQFQDLNFRSKEAWQQVYDELSGMEGDMIDEEQPVSQDEVLLSGGEIETEIDPQQVKDFLVATGARKPDTEIVQESYTEKGQIDLPKREEEITPHLVLDFPAAQRIAKQGKKREGTFISRRIKSDKSKGFWG